MSDGTGTSPVPSTPPSEDHLRAHVVAPLRPVGVAEHADEQLLVGSTPIRFAYAGSIACSASMLRRCRHRHCA